MIHLNLMRMVCDSTYAMDQETRHDTKIDELMSIVKEVIDAGEERMVPGQTQVVVAREKEMKSEKSDLKGVLEPGLSSEEIGPEAPSDPEATRRLVDS